MLLMDKHHGEMLHAVPYSTHFQPSVMLHKKLWGVTPRALKGKRYKISSWSHPVAYYALCYAGERSRSFLLGTRLHGLSGTDMVGHRISPLYSINSIALNIGHRYGMVWVGRALKDHLFPFSLSWAGTSSTRPCFSDLPPTWFEHCQQRDIHRFSG